MHTVDAVASENGMVLVRVVVSVNSLIKVMIRVACFWRIGVMV